MKRYFFFFIAAFCLHGVLLIPLWIKPELGQPFVGGGTGGAISISIAPVVPLDEGYKVAPPEKARAGHHGFDRETSTSAGVGRGPSAGPGVGSGSSQEGFDEILAQIRSLIERAKHYPLMARRRGVEGTVDVTFEIQENGRVKGLKLTRSSGSSSLDEAALKTIRRAAPFPFYPQPIRIGIRFALREKRD